MAHINLVNLNDAIYRMIYVGNSNFGYGYDGNNYYLREKHFDKVNCPKLHLYNRNQVVTYKDFVSILAGNEDVTNTWVGDLTSRCLYRNDYAGYIGYQTWGRTFGKYRGPRGLPLCEVKPLDEMFFYYEALCRRLCYYPDYNVALNAAQLIKFYYNTGSGWINSWGEDGILTSNWRTLQPGMYAACTSPLGTGDIQWEVIDETGPTNPGETQIITRGYGGNQTSTWRQSNTVFFVDSPIYIRPNWSSSNYMMVELFRFTPPGYWVP